MQYHRRSPGMMTAGIIVTSAAPVVLVAGVLASTNALDGCRASVATGYSVDSYQECDQESAHRIYAVLAVSAVMLGAGIPMIIIGAKKVPNTPADNALLLPYAAPGRAGLTLHVTF